MLNGGAYLPLDLIRTMKEVKAATCPSCGQLMPVAVLERSVRCFECGTEFDPDEVSEE